MAKDQDSYSGLYVEPDLFRRGLEVTHQLMDAGILRVLVGSARQLQFELTEHRAQEALNANDLTLTDLRRVFYDIEDVLVAATQNVDAERFAAGRSDPERWDDGEVEEPEIAKQKLTGVLSVFDVDSLRRRLWLKANTKTELPRRVLWEVVQKLGDEESPVPTGGPVTFGVLRLESEPPDWRYAVQTGSQLVLTVDEEDVAYMRDALDRLHQALHRADNSQNE